MFLATKPGALDDAVAAGDGCGCVCERLLAIAALDALEATGVLGCFLAGVFSAAIAAGCCVTTRTGVCVTGCGAAGFAAVADEGADVADLGAAAASVWAAAGSLVAAIGASRSAEVAPGFSGCGEESDCWLTNMSRNCFLPAGPAAIHPAANETSTMAAITAAKRLQLPCLASGSASVSGASTGSEKRWTAITGSSGSPGKESEAASFRLSRGAESATGAANLGSEEF